MMQLPTLLINLDRSTDRLRFMEMHAEAGGWNFERIPAVDGETVPLDIAPQFMPCRTVGMTAGEVGCYASHMVVWQRIAAQGWPCALVLEDDALLSTDAIDVAAQAATAIEGWDIIHLSGVLKRRRVVPVVNLKGGRQLVRHTRLPVNTTGYLISAAGVSKMIYPGPRVRPVDMEIRYAWLRELEVYGVAPAPIGVAGFPTTIDSNWRTDPPVKHRWAPGLASRAYGMAYRLRRTMGARLAIHRQ